MRDVTYDMDGLAEGIELTSEAGRPWQTCSIGGGGVIDSLLSLAES